VSLPDSIAEYLRAHAQVLGDRIFESHPPLHSIDDPPSPIIGKLLRKPYPAQTLAIMGLVRRRHQARAGAVIAECGTGKTLISVGAVHTHAEGRRYTALAMVLPQLVEQWCREAFLTLARVRVFIIDGLRTPSNSKGHDEVKLRNGRIVGEALKTSLSELRLRKSYSSGRHNGSMARRREVIQCCRRRKAGDPRFQIQKRCRIGKKVRIQQFFHSFPPSGHNQSVHLEECPLRPHLPRRPKPYAYSFTAAKQTSRRPLAYSVRKFDEGLFDLIPHKRSLSLGIGQC
jgi:hypothetical protein